MMAIVALAGLAGASGVALAAIAAHGAPSASLTTAALLLILHACAAVAFGSLSASQGTVWLWVAAALLAGAALFTGDVAAQTLGGFKLFPFAAPTGGSIMIASWLAAAVVALAGYFGAR